MPESDDLFERWYVRPLTALECLPNGDGGFIVMATCVFLYERYAKAYLINNNQPATDNGVRVRFQIDFDVDERTANVFWDVLRNGLLHAGMPQQMERGRSLTRWETRHDYPMVFLENINGDEILKFNPWTFRDRVLALWNDNRQLINNNFSYPFGNIYRNANGEGHSGYSPDISGYRPTNQT